MLKCYPVPGKAKSRMLCEAFAASAPAGAEGAVFAGVKAGNVEDWRRVRASGKNWYYIDNSYFDQTRDTHFRVTHRQLQVRPIFGGWDTDGSRFHQLGIKIQPWRVGLNTSDLPVLIIPQSDDHMRYTIGYGSADDWLGARIAELRSLGEDFIVRPWSSNKPEIRMTLAEDLDHCKSLLTHTSAAAVMATLAGLSVRCDRQCCVHSMSYYPDCREAWAGVLADNQFTLDEIKKGMAWCTLHP